MYENKEMEIMRSMKRAFNDLQVGDKVLRLEIKEQGKNGLQLFEVSRRGDDIIQLTDGIEAINIPSLGEQVLTWIRVNRTYILYSSPLEGLRLVLEEPEGNSVEEYMVLEILEKL